MQAAETRSANGLLAKAEQLFVDCLKREALANAENDDRVSPVLTIQGAHPGYLHQPTCLFEGEPHAEDELQHLVPRRIGALPREQLIPIGLVQSGAMDRIGALDPMKIEEFPQVIGQRPLANLVGFENV